MDGALYAVFLAATFIGRLTTGFSGFAFGVVVSGLYLHLLVWPTTRPFAKSF
jgi:uncharacterized protein